MFWTFEIASRLEDAPYPCTLDELKEYAERSCTDPRVLECLAEMEDEDELYESITDVWPDYAEWRELNQNEDEDYE